jgi:hypothetical protein
MRETVAPDQLDPVVGWRVWDVVELDGHLRLCSLTFWSVWLPGRPALAACRRPLVDRRAGIPDHDAPAASCTCGIYATTSAHGAVEFSRRFARRRDTVHRVLGRVTLWGTVVECESGWRASRAYPESLVVRAPTGRGFLSGRLRQHEPARPAEEIAVALAEYGAPVDVVAASNDAKLVEALEPRRPAL